MEEGLFPSTPFPGRAGRPFVKVPFTSLTDTFLFRDEDQDYELIGVSLNYAVAGGANYALQLRNVPDATAIASGTAMLESAFDLTASATNTQTGVLASTTQTNRILPKGNWLALDFSGTIGSFAGLGGTAHLKPINPNPKA